MPYGNRLILLLPSGVPLILSSFKVAVRIGGARDIENKVNQKRGFRVSWGQLLKNEYN